MTRLARLFRNLALLCVPSAGLAAAPPLPAVSANSQPATAPGVLQRGIERLEAEDLDAARNELEAAAKQGPYRLDEVVQLYRGLGVVRAYFDDSVGARWAFERLLAIAPAAMLPYTTSPKATFLFQEVKEALRTRPALRVDLTTPAVAALDQPIDVVVARAADPLGAVQRIEVWYRLKGKADFERVPVATIGIGERATVQLPGVPAAQAQVDEDGVAKAIVEIAVVAFDAAGWEIARTPDPSSPREVPVGFDAPGPWYTRWWLWGIAGGTVVLVGGATAALLLQPPPATVPFSYRVVQP
jgi:hypothetical protein